MPELRIRPYQPDDEGDVLTLWRDCHLITASNNPRLDIQRKLRVNGDLFFVATLGGKVVGTCMAGYEGHRGWINYLAVTPPRQRQGIARQLMNAAEQKLRTLGCPKINLQVRATNSQVIEFYKHLGFREDHVASLGKRLVNDPGYSEEENVL